MMPAKSHLPSLKDLGELREPWLPSGTGERLGFRVSTCDEVISLTSAARSDWKRWLLRTEKVRVTAGCGRPVRRSHKRTVLNTLLPQFSDFVPVILKVYD